MKYAIRIGAKSITLEHADLDDVINVDDLAKIDTSNLFGEAVTISAAANRIGLMKAEIEASLSDLKLDLKYYENNFRTKLRIEAAKSGGSYIVRFNGDEISVKLTEKALETCYESEEEWLNLKREIIVAEKNVSAMAALYWAVQDKSRKLNGLVSSTTPEDFVEGMIEGKINGILITKDPKAGSIK